MKELLENIVRMIVDDPDSVKVEVVENERGITLKLSVAPEDMSKVIGREGRIAKSLRTVIKAASRKEDKHFYVDIV